MSSSRRGKSENKLFLHTSSVSILKYQHAGELSHDNVEKTEGLYNMIGQLVKKIQEERLIFQGDIVNWKYFHVNYCSLKCRYVKRLYN